jgi:Ca2+-binding EF-hand superfamily protein
MHRFFGRILLAAAAVTLPAAAQTPPPVPLPQWFIDIDTAKKGEVTRSEFLKFRMKLFEQLDVNKDGKLTLEEFMKVVEPPISADAPNGPTREERQSRARSEFQTMDTNANGFVERAEAEALVHSEFNQYDTDRDNKVTEPEIRLIVQRAMAREATERQQAEVRRHQGRTALNEFMDMQLREVDKLDKNNDGKLSQQEYAALAGPADGPQAQGLLPYDIRRQLVMRKFQEIDTNKDGQLDRVEVTSYAIKRFLEMDTDKDRFLSEEEFKLAQENDAKKMRELIPTLQPQPPAQPKPAPVQPQPAPAAPPGLAPGLPQRTR